MREGKSKAKAGTAGYLAPEILEGSNPSPPSDIWALGCLLYAMLTVSLPFPTQVSTGEVNSSGSPSKRKIKINYDVLDLEPLQEAGELC
jgi:serine/threonine protein kinase